MIDIYHIPPVYTSRLLLKGSRMISVNHPHSAELYIIKYVIWPLPKMMDSDLCRPGKFS